MNRKFTAIVAAMVLTISVVSVALAAGGGNARKGKYLYRKNCRTCHGKTASDLSPATKTQAQWKATFADKTKIPCNDKWSGMKDKDVNDIYTYLHDFAKDSPTPAKCS